MSALPSAMGRYCSAKLGCVKKDNRQFTVARLLGLVWEQYGPQIR